MDNKNSMEEEKQNSNMFSAMKPLAWIISGAAIGGVIAYFFDPSRGKRRRALIKDKGTRLANQANEYGGKIYRRLKNQGEGVIAKASKLTHQERVDDEALMNRVRSEFGRKIRHARAIEVEVNNGEVTLSGPILASEIDDLIRCVKDVPGVKDVINQLDVHKSAGKISALQGEGKEYLQ